MSVCYSTVFSVCIRSSALFCPYFNLLKCVTCAVTLYNADPDVLVGHDFLGVSLDVLLGRMKDLKAEHWSRLGRFRRAKWIPIGKQGSNIKFLAGRLLCDLASDGARVRLDQFFVAIPPLICSSSQLNRA